MRSAAMFLALMATGVLIMLIYIWSGESMVALILSIVTLFALLAVIEWRPWAVAGPDVEPTQRPRGSAGAGTGARSGADGGEPGPGRSGRRGRGSGSGADRFDDGPAGPAEPLPAWRSRFDITWDQRGVSGVALGNQAPQLWSWSQIDDISQIWCQAIVDDGRSMTDPESDDRDSQDLESQDPESQDRESVDIEERVGLCLDFPSLRNPEEPDRAEVMFGPDQDPDEVLADLRAAWRDSKVAQSRFHDLTAEERTLTMGRYFGRGEIDLTTTARSPELLYQEVRRALLANGDLCRLAPDADFETVLDSFDRLLEANGCQSLSRAEAEELEAADGPDRLLSLHWTLDWVAEQRGCRLAFVDQGGDDYLIGLVPADSADDWDGQTVGGGSVRVVLDLPSR